MQGARSTIHARRNSRDREEPTAHHNQVVIARLDRPTQYAVASRLSLPSLEYWIARGATTAVVARWWCAVSNHDADRASLTRSPVTAPDGPSTDGWPPG